MPSGVALRNLISDHGAAGGDAVAARLLRYLSEVIPREHWLDLNDPWFGRTAALRLCRFAERELLPSEPSRNSPTGAAELQTGSRERSRKGFALSVGTTYGIAKGEVGLSLLEGGWSHAEASHVWSNGQQASIVLPVEPGDEKAVRCRLTGFHIGQPFRVQVRMNGKAVLSRNFNGQSSKMVDLLVPLHVAALDSNSHLHRIEMCFSKTWSPSRLYANSSNRRELAVALSAIRLEAADDGLDAAMLDVVDGLHGAGLGRVAFSVVDQPAEQPVLADIMCSEIVDTKDTTPVIILVDLPEPSATLAGL